MLFNPHDSSYWDSHITRQLNYTHTFCQNAVSTKTLLVHIFHKNTPCIHVSLLKMCEVFPISCKTISQLWQIVVSWVIWWFCKETAGIDHLTEQLVHLQGLLHGDGYYLHHHNDTVFWIGRNTGTLNDTMLQMPDTTVVWRKILTFQICIHSLMKRCQRSP